MFATLRAETRLVWNLLLQESGASRKRMILTMVAITWGTLSIVMLLSFGEGLKNAFQRGKKGMGDNIGVLWAGATTKAFQGLPSGRALRFNDDDATLLIQRVPEIGMLSREYRTSRGLTAGEKTVNAPVRGVDPEFGELRHIYPQPGGRFITGLDAKEKRRVVVLGEELAQELFGREDVVGETILLNRSVFTVIGVAQKKTMMGMYSGPDKRQASIPATTFKAMFTSARPSNLVYKPRKAEDADALKANLYNVLGGRYRFDPSDRRALSIWDTREDARIVNNIAIGIQMFLGIIGALTLFVAGMGVANIMYASVKERTREIGVKMAIGAKSRQVMAPFVIQSLVITMFGGVIGTSVALVIMFLISLLPLDNVEALELLGRPTFSLPIAVATTMVLGVVGTLAGYFPARRAATISPAESLRYE